MFDGPREPLAVRLVKVSWILAVSALLLLALCSIPQYRDWDDGPRRGLFASLIVLMSALAFPLGIVAAIVGGATVVALERTFGTSIAFEAVQPLLISAFIASVGYFQWFRLVPSLVSAWRTRTSS